jgi:hypothetical protein
MNIISYVTAATAPQTRRREAQSILSPHGYEKLRNALLEALNGVGIELDPLDPPEEWIELHSLTRRCEVHALYSADQGRSHLQVGFNWTASHTAQAMDRVRPDEPTETMVWLRFVGSFASTAAPDVRTAAAWASQVDALARQHLQSVNWRPPQLGFALKAMATNSPPDTYLCTASQEGSLVLSASSSWTGSGPAALNRLWTMARQIKTAWPAWEASLAILTAPAPAAVSSSDSPQPDEAHRSITPSYA